MAELNVTVEGQSAGAENATAESNSQAQETKAEKTYTEKEMQSLIDKRVTEGLKTARENWEKEYAEKLQAEKDEAARLAKMSAEERAKAEFEKERETFEAERKKYNSERLTFECAKQLGEAKLPTSFADLLTGADAETTKKNIDVFSEKWNAAIEAAVTERLKGSPPKIATKQENTDAFLAGFSKK